MTRVKRNRTTVCSGFLKFPHSHIPLSSLIVWDFLTPVKLFGRRWEFLSVHSKSSQFTQKWSWIGNWHFSLERINWTNEECTWSSCWQKKWYFTQGSPKNHFCPQNINQSRPNSLWQGEGVNKCILYGLICHMIYSDRVVVFHTWSPRRSLFTAGRGSAHYWLRESYTLHILP